MSGLSGIACGRSVPDVDLVIAEDHRARSRRVTLLLIGVVVLSLADLVITLTHLRSLGMMEANPIAAFLIRTTNSAWILSVYKILTTGICVAVLYWLRRMRSGEIAAWISVAILAFMCVMWHQYSAHFDDVEALTLAQSGGYGENWLYLD